MNSYESASSEVAVASEFDVQIDTSALHIVPEHHTCMFLTKKSASIFSRTRYEVKTCSWKLLGERTVGYNKRIWVDDASQCFDELRENKHTRVSKLYTCSISSKGFLIVQYCIREDPQSKNLYRQVVV